MSLLLLEPCFQVIHQEETASEAIRNRILLRQGIRRRMKEIGVRFSSCISVEVEDHRVLLSGRVPSYYQRQLCIEAARSIVGGAYQIHDHLVVTPPPLAAA